MAASTQPDLSKLPQELKNSSRWVLFRLEDVDDNGKVRKRCKVPYCPKQPTRRASSTDASTWSSLDAALAALESFEPFNAYKNTPNNRGVGLTFGPPWFAVDLDACFDPENDLVAPWAEDILAQLPPTYTELSPSGTGFHLWYRCDKSQDLPDGHRSEKAEVYSRGRYFTMSGRHYADTPLTVTEVPLAEAKTIFALIKSQAKKKTEPILDARATYQSEEKVFQLLMKGKLVEAGFEDHPGDNRADLRLCGILAKKFNGNREMIEQVWLTSGLKREKTLRDDYRHDTLDEVLKNFKPNGKEEIDPETWREGCRSFDQLTKELPAFLISGLVPEKALTAIVAHSYNFKTWLALALAKAISTGSRLWCFDGPSSPLPVIYHVPEMNEAFVRQYMTLLEFESSELFLVRPMECGLWSLDDPRMLRASEGRMNFFDTAGYFNPADDTSSYQQSLKFASLFYKLFNNGALGAAALFHPPKSAKENQSWTLENSILGSAGYGGIMRSCLRMQNLNADLNDPHGWVYVQGMKNPGLKPFQLEGPAPLKMKVEPGESPYLAELLSGKKIDPRRAEAFKMFAKGEKRDAIRGALKCKPNVLSQWRREWAQENTRNSAASQPSLIEDEPTEDAPF